VHDIIINDRDTMKLMGMSKEYSIALSPNLCVS